jgi:glucans biosynthesis protein
MPHFDRRFVINVFALSGAAALAPRGLGGALAQPSGQGQPPESHFGFEDVVKRARELAAAPYDGSAPK